MKLCEITSPAQLKHCTEEELYALAGEIREEIMKTVAVNGGHLASNLGVVELTLALHRVFDCPRDQIIFDVGHQCYPHKLLTGRYKDFHTLRQTDGLCGFPRREESEYDAFGTGHASTAISAAVGMARARDIRNEDYHVVAVAGDGALTGGMCYEALNDTGSKKCAYMVVLNDNNMSITRNVGGLSRHLTRLRTSRGWLDTKKAISKGLLRLPLCGDALYKAFRHIKDRVRNIFVRDQFFTSLGLRYFGPIDGHDITEMERVFNRVKKMQDPVVVHVVTQKGAGLPKAEEHPEKYHGVSPAEKTEKPRSLSAMGVIAGDHLSKRADGEPLICAITAAMRTNVGLDGFKRAHRARFFDVGIAEEHAVTMAAGMAARGLRPFVMIYETFMQRGVDQVLTDVCLQNLPVCFLMDRAGIGGEDGPTHHGLFGIPLLRSLPNLTLLCPRNGRELTEMIDFSLGHDGPVAIRYARDEAAGVKGDAPFRVGQWEVMQNGGDAVLLTFSALIGEGLKAAQLLKKKGVSLMVVNASSLKPLDEKMLRFISETGMPCFTAEESVLAGGFGSAVAEYCLAHGFAPPRRMLGVPDEFVPHGKREILLERLGLSAAGIAQSIAGAMKK